MRRASAGRRASVALWFRESLKLAPGLRLTLSKRGASISASPRSFFLTTLMRLRRFVTFFNRSWPDAIARRCFPRASTHKSLDPDSNDRNRNHDNR